MLQNILNKTILLIFLCAAIFSVYGLSLRNGFIGDDHLTITDNFFVHSIYNFPQLFSREYLTTPEDLAQFGGGEMGAGEMSYRPVVTATYFFDFFFWQRDPVGYHLTNVVLHILNAVLLFILISRATNKPLAAFCGALFFGLHPAPAESVIIPSYREDLLACGFGLLALITHRSQRHPWFAAFSLMLACFSKEAGLTWIAVIMLYDYFMRPGDQWLKGAWARYQWTVLAVVFYAVIRFGVMHSDSFTHPLWWRNASEHGVIVLKVLGGYLCWILWPVHIPSTLPMTPFPFGFETMWAGLAGIFGLVLLAVGFRRKSFLCFSIVAFGLFLLSVSQLIALDNIMAARYLYLPMAAAGCILAALAGDILNNETKNAAAVTGVFILVLYGAEINYKIQQMRSDIVYRQSLIADYPGTAELYRHLAGVYEEAGRLPEALEALRAGQTFTPQDCRFNIDRALIEQRQGQFDLARRELQAALNLPTGKSFAPFIAAKLREMDGRAP